MDLQISLRLRFFLMQWSAVIVATRMTVGDDHPSVDPYPTCRRRQQVLVTMRAEPSFEFSWDRNQVFHGDLACELNVSVRKRKLPFTRIRLCETEQIGDPLGCDTLLNPFLPTTS
jgi:hypothetical protein